MKITCFDIACYHTVITYASIIINHSIAERTNSIANK
jgi:hypothetical protein